MECRLTTLDNPYNPFTQFDEWYAYDENNGYCTCGLIDRLAIWSDDTPDAIFKDEYERVVDEICHFNILGLYKKVTRADYEDGKWKPLDLSLLNGESEVSNESSKDIEDKDEASDTASDSGEKDDTEDAKDG